MKINKPAEKLSTVKPALKSTVSVSTKNAKEEQKTAPLPKPDKLVPKAPQAQRKSVTVGPGPLQSKVPAKSRGSVKTGPPLMNESLTMQLPNDQLPTNNDPKSSGANPETHENLQSESVTNSEVYPTEITNEDLAQSAPRGLESKNIVDSEAREDEPLRPASLHSIDLSTINQNFQPRFAGPQFQFTQKLSFGQNLEGEDVAWNEEDQFEFDEHKQDDRMSDLSALHMKMPFQKICFGGKVYMEKANTMYVKNTGNFFGHEVTNADVKPKELARSSRDMNAIEENHPNDISSDSMGNEGSQHNANYDEKGEFPLPLLKKKESVPSFLKEVKIANSPNPFLKDQTLKSIKLSEMDSMMPKRKLNQSEIPGVEIGDDTFEQMQTENDKMEELLDRYTDFKFNDNYLKIYNNANISIEKYSPNIRTLEAKFPSNKIVSSVTINNQILNKSTDADITQQSFRTIMKNTIPQNMLLSTITTKEIPPWTDKEKDEARKIFASNYGDIVFDERNINEADGVNSIARGFDARKPRKDTFDDITTMIGNQVISEQMIDTGIIGSKGKFSMNPKEDGHQMGRRGDFRTVEFQLLFVPSKTLLDTSDYECGSRPYDESHLRSEFRSTNTFGMDNGKSMSSHSKNLAVSFGNVNEMNVGAIRLSHPKTGHSDITDTSFKPYMISREISRNYVYIQGMERFNPERQIREPIVGGNSEWGKYLPKHEKPRKDISNSAIESNKHLISRCAFQSEVVEEKPKIFFQQIRADAGARGKEVFSQLGSIHESDVNNREDYHNPRQPANFNSNFRDNHQEKQTDRRYSSIAREVPQEWGLQPSLSQISSGMNITKFSELANARNRRQSEAIVDGVMKFFKKIIVYSAKLEQLKETLDEANILISRRLYNQYACSKSEYMTIFEFKAFLESLNIHISEINLQRLIYHLQVSLCNEISVEECLKPFHFQSFFRPMSRIKSSGIENFNPSFQSECHESRFELSEPEYQTIRHIVIVNVKMLEDVAAMVRETKIADIQRMVGEFFSESTCVDKRDLGVFIRSNGLNARSEDIDSLLRFFVCYDKGVISKEKFFQLFSLEIWGN
jgi:hypothetical protein